MNQDLKCVNPDHSSSSTLICLDQNCSNKGLICFQCMEEKHYGHKIISFNSFLKKIDEFCNEFDEEKFNEKPQEFNYIQDAMGKIDSSIEIFHECLKNASSNINYFLQQKRNYLENLKPFIRKEKIMNMLSNIKNFKEPESASQELINFLNIIEFSNNNPQMRGKEISENEQKNVIDLNKTLEDYYLFLSNKLKLIEKEINNFCDLEKCLSKKQEKEVITIEEKNKLRRKRKRVLISNGNAKRVVKIQNQRFLYEPIKDNEYLQSEEVLCHFCHESSRNSELFKKLGSIFGPYNFNEKPYYVHEMCALWTSDIHLDKKDSITNSFNKFIDDQENNNCGICRKSGAGLSCCAKDCINSYHFKCIVDDKEVVFHKDKFKITCPKHRPKKRIRPKENQDNLFTFYGKENIIRRPDIQENSNFSKEIIEENSKNSFGLVKNSKEGDNDGGGHISKEDKLFLLEKFQENEKQKKEENDLPSSFEDIDENNEEQLEEVVKKKIKFENQ